MASHKIVVIAGDHCGPEVSSSAAPVPVPERRKLEFR